MNNWIVCFILVSLTFASQSTLAFTPSVPSESRGMLSWLFGTTQLLQGELDTETLYDKSAFPIKPDELIRLAKDVIITRGVGLKDGGECLAENFVFRAAFVETSRDEFFTALKTFKLEDSFELKQQYFGWVVDPIQTNRVLFFNRQEGKHIGNFMGAKPTNETLILPPQCLHVDFNNDGKVIEFGFYVVDRAQGNTGGLGGAFGFFYGVGKPLPFPECQPYTMSLRRRLFTVVANFLTKAMKKKEA